MTTQPKSQPEPELATRAAGHSEEASDAPLDALERAGLEAEDMGDADPVEVLPDGRVLIDGKEFVDQEAFYQYFIQVHEVGGFMFQLKTLSMAGEIPQTRAASDELYNLILKTSWLQFMIKPESENFKMIFAFGAYGLAIAPPVMAELAEKKRAKREAAKAAKAKQPANDNAENPDYEEETAA